MKLTESERVLLKAASSLIMDAMHCAGVNPFQDTDVKSKFYYELLLAISKHHDRYNLDYKFEEAAEE